MNERLTAHVAGRVQGVGFRFHTEREARRQGITGWVRNRADGTVELVAEGPRDALERLLAWCRQGPPQARVARVETHWSAASGEFDDFRARA
jgi:acylphosphatase